MTWYNYSNVLRINTIEDPHAPEKIAKYTAYEDSIGNNSLLQNASFTIRHPENVVANPGFEDHPTLERSLTSFNDQITSWLPASPTPDFFITPTAARGGLAFAGIRVYSIHKDIEYIQNKLNHQLIRGQKYCFSAYVKLGPSSSFATDAFGVHFSPNAIQFKKLDESGLTPDLSLDNEYLTFKSRWMVMQCSYTADGTENWMTIGSFKPIDSIHIKSVFGRGGESYYYIDDVSLVPIDKDEECPCNIDGSNGSVDMSPKRPSLTSASKQQFQQKIGSMEIGDRLILEDIFFNIDKYDILPESEIVLKELVDILNKYPKIVLEVSGHTSNTGDYDHNVNLSKKRAIYVGAYLIQKGIDGARIQTKGYGPDMPIAENDTEENRKQNRRVEIKILDR